MLPQQLADIVESAMDVSNEESDSEAESTSSNVDYAHCNSSGSDDDWLQKTVYVMSENMIWWFKCSHVNQISVLSLTDIKHITYSTCSKHWYKFGWWNKPIFYVLATTYISLMDLL